MWSKMLAIGIYLIFITFVSCIDQSDQYPETDCGSFDKVSNTVHDVTDRIRSANTNSKLLDIGGMASLHNSDTDLGPGTHRCGGILISRNFLLTAAHCMIRNGTERITTISLGRENLEHNPTPGPDTYKVEKVFYPTDFVSTPNDYDDIALIKTDRPVLYSKEIWPFCLPESNETYSDYWSVDISGWGQVDQLAVASSSLQTENIKIVENSRCEDLWRKHASHIYDHKIRKYEYPDGLTAQLLCAGDRGVDACSGDSGGPMSYQDSEGRHIVIGVISKGINCPIQPIVPGFYTNIPYYVDWIYDTALLPRRTKSATSSSQKASPPIIALCSLSCTRGICLRTNTCGCNPSQTRDQCQNEFYLAASGGEIEYVKNALSSNTNPNWRNDKSLTPLMAATEHGHVSVIQVLIDGHAKLEITTQTSTGSTALYQAAHYNQAAVARVLLRAGANVNARTAKLGLTPLMKASNEGYINVVEALLDAPSIAVDLVETTQEWTALHFAAAYNHLSIARLLLGKGADKTKQTKDGFTPAALARHQGNDQMESTITYY